MSPFSCMAMKDLMKDVPEMDLVGYFVQIWTVLFKVMDDVKESVRKAANALAIALGNVIILLITCFNHSIGYKFFSQSINQSNKHARLFFTSIQVYKRAKAFYLLCTSNPRFVCGVDLKSTSTSDNCKMSHISLIWVKRFNVIKLTTIFFYCFLQYQLSVKFCESQNTKLAEEALRNVLDVVLTVGITSRVNEVKSIR